MRASMFGLLTIVVCGVMSLCGSVATNAAYPDHLVRLVVGFPPGGGADLVARIIAAKLAEKWGEPVIVVNRVGANGVITADFVAHSAPDGYTISLVTPTLTMMNLPVSGDDVHLNFDPINGFAPIILVVSQPDVLLMNPSVPAQNIKELVALAKSKPGTLNFASTGPGGPTTMDMILFMSVTGTKMVEVPYKGDAPKMIALLGGEVQLGFSGIGTASADPTSGKLKALALMGIGNVRSPRLPDVPTLSEALDQPSLEGGTWEGIVAPAGTPESVVDKLHDDIVAVVNEPSMKKQLTDQGFLMVAGTPAEFKDRIRNDNEKWGALLKSAAGK